MIRTKGTYACYPRLLLLILYTHTLLAIPIHQQRPPFSVQFLNAITIPPCAQQHANDQEQFSQNISCSLQTEFHTYISCASGLYATSKILWKCRELYLDNEQSQSIYARILHTCVPRLLVRLCKHHKLLLYTFEVTIETLIYKAIAHCLITCAHDSLLDIIKMILKKITPF